MALKSKFARKNDQFKANKIFTDRTEPQAVFSESVRQIVQAQDEEHSRQIIVYYGKGGIGKTSLLKRLSGIVSREVYMRYPQYSFRNVAISLEAYDYVNPVNILSSIRSQIDGDGSLFDYALVQYYAKARVSIDEIKSKNSALPAMVMGILDEAIGICTGSASLPNALVEKGIAFIKDRRFRAKYQEEIDQIAGLNEFEIFERLPYYLGLCLNHSAENGVLHTLFLDSYESLKRRTDGLVTSVDSMEWLQELFLCTERTLFVVGSRDRLDWEKQDADWGIYLNQHLLANLSDEDCRWFLEQIPIQNANGEPETETIGHIIRHAGGVPLYLDLCVDLFVDSVNSGKSIDFSHFNGSSTIIDRYMRHLGEKDQHSVSVLATLESFDCDFALRMLEKQKLSYPMDEIDSLLEKSIFLQLEGSRGLWKVDESVRSHIYEQMPTKWRIVLLGDLLDTLLERRSGNVYPYFAMALRTVVAYPEYIPQVSAGLYEALDYFAGVGYWNELRQLLQPCLESEHKALRSLAVFAELIWLRRTGKLAEAVRFAQANPLEKEELGVWYYMYRFLLIHIRHLLGHYDESLLGYQELTEEMELVKNTIPVHIYNTAAMKYADLLFLKGGFARSLELTEKMLDRGDTPLPDVIELLRIKGHIYRFQRMYEKAELIYRSALKLVRNHGLWALEGKLYTNLTEATCMTDPEQSLQWYEKALEKNGQMDNGIEVGKAQAAASVATTAAGKPAQGELLARTAVMTAESTGYQSGRVFALLALAYAQKGSGKPEEAAATLRQAKQLQLGIGVYHYLIPEQELL